MPLWIQQLFSPLVQPTLWLLLPILLLQIWAERAGRGSSSKRT